MAEGVTGATSIVGHTTISGPSWTTILTGVWDNKSGVINNLFNPKPYDKWPTVVNLIEYSTGTTSTPRWSPIGSTSLTSAKPAATQPT